MVKKFIWGTSPRLCRPSLPKSRPVHGEFVITLRLASGTDRGNDTAKRSDQGRHGRAVVRQIFRLGCCH